MNTISRTITGTVLIIAGLALMVISPRVQFISLIWGIPIFIMGFFILFNKKEDKIEEIKMKGGRK